MIDAALEIAEHAPPACVIVQRDQQPVRAAGRSRPRLGRADGRRPAGRMRCRSPRPIRSTCSTPRARPGGRRESCATTAATPSRCCGACGTSTTSEPGDVFWTASDVGWVVGHSYIVYGPLLVGATTVLYEGKPVGTPDAGAFWRVVAEHGSRRCSPRRPRSARSRRRIRTACTSASTTCPLCRYLFQAGERLDPDTYHWASERLGVPVVDHWWQTETGWAIAANPMGVEQLRHQAGLADRADAGIRRADPAARRLGGRTRTRRARSASSCRCRRARCRRCGVTTTGTSSRISRRSPATT